MILKFGLYLMEFQRRNDKAPTFQNFSPINS